MKLPDHVDKIRILIESSFDKQFAQLGISKNKQSDIEKLPESIKPKRIRFEEMLKNHIGETGDYQHAREKLLEELTFTLFNRLAAIKVMEAAALFPPILTKLPEHGDRSFGHKAWLETNPHNRREELDGIREYIKHAFNELGNTLPLYNKNYPYALLPDSISLNEIIDTMNAVEKDSQVGADTWLSDDILGWLYESYNNVKKKEHKESGDKTEYNKVSLQSQVYTPRWVVQFLVENSLGKLYLEMYPDSEIKQRYKIANPPSTQERQHKPLPQIMVIDPACGSGNFLLYAFDFFYELYIDQIENYGADYDEKKIPKLIIENNLHGIDLDDRAVQLAQLGLYIKAKKKNRTIGELSFSVVSSDFYLPDYETVKHIFENGGVRSEKIGEHSECRSQEFENISSSQILDSDQQQLIREIWDDLKYAYKFGSLIRIDERLKSRLQDIEKRQESEEQELFTQEDIDSHKSFASTFFNNIKTAVEKHAEIKGNTFLTGKTRDAITFLELLTKEYDVAMANPPYTDSSDFGPELKKFIEANYKKPYKFNTNLYATFIKRSYELVGAYGKIAMIHPRTFMFIKTFEDVRKFMIDKTHINVFVDYSLSNLFGVIMVDPAFYVLEKGVSTERNAWFISLDRYTRTPKEKYKKKFCLDALEDYINDIENENNYTIPQDKLKIIKSWPFIYWISDEFREKFACGEELENILKAKKGLGTQAERFFRFWWEVDRKSISADYYIDNKKWVQYVKGGPYKKWYGNIWLILNWESDGKEVKLHPKTNMRNPDTYFEEGIACSLLSSKGTSFRFQPSNVIYDSTTRSIFFEDDSRFRRNFVLGLLNSKLCSYILDCLNSTVAVNSNDIHRVPLIKPISGIEGEIDTIVNVNMHIKKFLCQYSMIEYNHTGSPIYYEKSLNSIKLILMSFFNFENHLLAQVLINEAIINEKIFEVYDLTEHDKAMIIAKEGDSIGGLPVSSESRDAYLRETEATKEFPLDNVRDFIESLPTRNFAPEEREKIENGFLTLYQSNNDLEEFCIRYQVNPINVWYWFKQSNVIPKQRMQTLAMEFLVDMIREILMEDQDGIIPLVANAGGKKLLDRIEEKFREKGFTPAQYSSFDSLLGRPLYEYLNKHLFTELSDHLNLFMYLPKTPFIWHLSSGPLQGFDCYIIIYKWSRDKLLRIRAVYMEHRERSLKNRQSDLSGNESADAQNERDLIYNQLQEIELYKVKIDELLAEGYNPILDDGVGKNIAPLQKKGMITYEVLNAGQLKKYLNADW
jgi:hypothetical protein